MVYNSILNVIGNTPVVKLNRVISSKSNNFYAKLEFLNPGGSVKDRIGNWLIQDAENKGLLNPGGVVIEATGGNTGIGLAIAAAVKGYKCIFTLPDKMSEVKIKCLRAFGAEVIVTPTAVSHDDPRSYYSVAKKLASEIPNSIYIDQYNNLANREYHYKFTGPEILTQLPNIDILIAGIGSGGTIMGVSKYLKEKNPEIKVIAIDPFGSVVYDMYKYGEVRSWTGPYLVEGIGKEFIPKNYDFDLIDDMVSIDDKDAFLMTRRILRTEGIYAGVSSGAAIVGTNKWLLSQGDLLDNKNILIIFPDSGDRYISKAYDDDWMIEKRFLETTVEQEEIEVTN